MIATKAPGKADAVWLGKGAEEQKSSAAESAPLRTAPFRTAPLKSAATANSPKPAKTARAEPVMVKAVPKFIEPQLAKLAGEPPDLAGWTRGQIPQLSCAAEG